MFRDPSVAEQVTDVRPSAKLLPDAGRQLAASDPQQTSFALAAKLAVAC